MCEIDADNRLRNRILVGDVRERIDDVPSSSIDTVVTSPPYWTLRDYEHELQIGLEKTPWDYIETVVEIIDRLRRVLRPEGNLLLNLGDTYNTDSIVRTDASGRSMHRGDDKYEEYHIAKTREQSGRVRRSPVNTLPKRSRLLIPSRVAINLIERGWVCHNRIAWVKPKGGRDSATDRFRPRHESWFYFSQDAESHYFDFSGRVPYDVLESPTANRGDHNAQYPVELVEDAIRRLTPDDGIVFDPFLGSGTTAVAAKRTGRDYLGIEVREDYAEKAKERIRSASSMKLSNWGGHD